MDPHSVVGPTNGDESTNNMAHEKAPVGITPGEVTSMRAGKTGEDLVCTREVIKKKATTAKPPADKTQKEKAPRKKPKTITEQATRPYSVNPASQAPILQHLAQQTTKTHSAKGAGVSTVHASLPKRSRKAKPLQTSSNTPKASRRKKNKESGPPQMLLSPRSAFKKMDEQVVWFGTSSQLVREGSPSLVPQQENPPDRGISQLESGQTTELTRGAPQKYIISCASTVGGLWSAATRELDGSLIEVDVIDLATTPRANNFPRETNKVLVSAIPGQKLSTTDTTPDLGNVGCANAVSGDLSLVGQGPTSELRPGFACSNGFVPVDETSRVNILRSRPSQVLPKQNKGAGSSTAADGPSLLDQSCQVKSNNIQPPKPDFAGYSTAQLHGALVSYGFKPIKNRNQMITLLEKCWEVKNRATLQSVESSAITPAPGAVENRGPSPIGSRELVTGKICASTETTQTASVVRDVTALEKPRGRPKKPSPVSAKAGEGTKKDPSKSLECGPSGDLLTAMENVASEDMDPSAPGVASPKRQRGRPRKRAVQEASASLPEQVVDQGGDVTSATEVAIQKALLNRRSGLGGGGLSTEAIPSVPGTPSITDFSLMASAEPTPTLSDEAKQQQTFDRISRAILSQAPPENACSMPNFHQKILMYDPIVIEDLAAWLNTKGLGDIGVDTEVGTAEVRAWCERNSVCCLWKEGLWGGTRSRH
jgi:Slx4 endonuclease